MALARVDLPDEQLKVLTGHQSVEAMYTYLGPDIKEQRLHDLTVQAQLDAQ